MQMSTKLITLLIVALVAWVGFRIFSYWEDIRDKKDLEREKMSLEKVEPSRLEGMPYTLYGSYEVAQRGGVKSMTSWYKRNIDQVKDPRRAWIELDYCTLLARDNPREAKRIFAMVKRRTPPDSPVYPRVKQMEETFE